MQIPLLSDIFIIFALSIVVTFISLRLGIPVIVAFLLTGLLGGPHGLGLIKAQHEVEILAEIGVILLLFTIGIEFSLKSLLKIKRAVFLGGALQLGLTILASFFIARLLGQSPGPALLSGFLIAVSSTAIVLKILQERAEMETPHGRISLAMLIFQDIAIVPMMLFIPLLAGAEARPGPALALLALKGAGIILFVFVSSRWLVPQLLYQVLRTRSKELFLLAIFSICLGIVWLTSALGLSLALGAFLAGLIVSESEYSHETLANILPFKNVFTSLFFISIGMLLDAGFLLIRPLAILAGTAGVLAIKALIAMLASLLLGYPLRTALLTGLILSQVGEFSFILSRTGLEAGLLPRPNYQLFLAISILSLAVTPFIIALAPRLSDLLLKLPFPRRLKTGLRPEGEAPGSPLTDHIVIIGYGINGRNVAKAARVAGLPFIIIEMNPETVRRERARGEPIMQGDASNELVLQHAGIAAARIGVIVISDAAATRRIAISAKKLNPNLHLIVRTRFFEELKPLHDLGADEVIPEEFETSIEIFTRVLMKYLVPSDAIDKLTAEIRTASYEMLRSPLRPGATMDELQVHLPGIEITALAIGPDSPARNRTLAELEFRKTFQINVVAVERDERISANPEGGFRLQQGDILLLLGTPEKLAAARHRL